MTLITQLFLVPVSARNIWHNDPLFVYKIQTKRKCIADYESILLLTQVRLIGFILQWLINYSFLSSYSKNLEAFPTERNEAYKMPSKIKKTRQEKQKKRGGEKATCKSKSQDCCVPFKSRSFAFCACANFVLANIFHLDQKAMKRTACKWLYGKF